MKTCYMKNILFALLLAVLPGMAFSQSLAHYVYVMRQFQQYYNHNEPTKICDLFSSDWGQARNDLWTKKENTHLLNTYGKLVSFRYAGIDSVSDKNKVRLFITKFTHHTHVTGIVMNKNDQLETFRFETYSPHIDSVFYAIEKVKLSHTSYP